MKKLVFATQVFSLVAMFPLIVILEMNHTKAQTSKSDSTPGFKQQTEIKSTSLPEPKNHSVENEVFSNTHSTFLLFNTF